MSKDQFTLKIFKINPKKVRVRSFSDLSIKFSLNFHLPKDSSLIFRFRGGRNNKNDWYCLQPYDSNSNGFTVLSLDKPAQLKPILITGKDLSIKYLICEEQGIKKNTKFQLKIYKTLVQSLVEKKKKIEIIVEFPNKKQKPILVDDSPTIEVIHSDFNSITIISPSLTQVNEEFKILIRIEDKFKNLVKNFKDKIQIYEFVKPDNRTLLQEITFEERDEGILKVEGLKLSKSGIFYIEAFYNDAFFKSNPIMCKEESLKRRLYWGYIHGHSLKSDGIRELHDYFDNIMNAGLNFGTVTEHDHVWETSDEDFEEIKQSVKIYHRDHEFVSFFGYEWGSWYSGYGDICIYNFEDHIPVFRSDLNKYNSTRKLIRSLTKYNGKILMIAHHTALRPGYRNWRFFDNSLEKLVEIYSTWGNQEYSSKKGNPLPPRYKFFGYGKYARKRGAILEKRDSFVSDALERGYKLGFVAGGDDHLGIYPSGSIDPDNGIYPSGIMAVWAETLTKESLWKALNNRKCYGTTGPRIIVEFSLNSYYMGDIIYLANNPQMSSMRKLSIFLLSSIPIKKIEIIRNNSVIDLITPNNDGIAHEYIDNDSFQDIALKHSQKNELFVFYYIRVFLSDNNMAWSSPIWLIKNV